jgi:hypothetical protein
MALTPENMTREQDITPGRPPDDRPEDREGRPEGNLAERLGSIFEEELVDGAPEHWALYPETNGLPVIPNIQVLPAGMWPWESPISKEMRAAKGENPAEPPKDYNEIIADALGFPFSKHPITGLPGDPGIASDPNYPGRNGNGNTTTRVTATRRTTSPPPAAAQL